MRTTVIVCGYRIVVELGGFLLIVVRIVFTISSFLKCVILDLFMCLAGFLKDVFFFFKGW